MAAQLVSHAVKRKRRRLLVAGQDLLSSKPAIKPLALAPLETWLAALPEYQDDGQVEPLHVAAGLTHSLIAYTTREGLQRLYSTGQNESGQLGIGYSSTERTRGHVEGFGGVRIEALAAGLASSYLLVRQRDCANKLFAFGSRMRGQLGLSSPIEDKPTARSMQMAARATEIALPPGKDGAPRSVQSMAVGFEHLLVLDDAGKLWATGANPDGQLGLGDQRDRDVLTEVALGPLQAHDPIVRMAAGADTSAFLTQRGLYTFGNSEYAQAGHGEIMDAVLRPRFVDWPRPVRDIAFGGSFALILDDEGVSAVGYGAVGQGEGALQALRPTPIPCLRGASAIRAAWNYAAAIRDGQLYIWGLSQGQTGRLGLGPTVERLYEPTRLPLPADLEGRAEVVDVQLGGTHLWAIVEDEV